MKKFWQYLIICELLVGTMPACNIVEGWGTKSELTQASDSVSKLAVTTQKLKDKYVNMDNILSKESTTKKGIDTEHIKLIRLFIFSSAVYYDGMTLILKDLVRVAKEYEREAKKRSPNEQIKQQLSEQAKTLLSEPYYGIHYLIPAIKSFAIILLKYMQENPCPETAKATIVKWFTQKTAVINGDPLPNLITNFKTALDTLQSALSLLLRELNVSIKFSAEKFIEMIKEDSALFCDISELLGQYSAHGISEEQIASIRERILGGSSGNQTTQLRRSNSNTPDYTYRGGGSYRDANGYSDENEEEDSYEDEDDDAYDNYGLTPATGRTTRPGGQPRNAGNYNIRGRNTRSRNAWMNKIPNRAR